MAWRRKSESAAKLVCMIFMQIFRLSRQGRRATTQIRRKETNQRAVLAELKTVGDCVIKQAQFGLRSPCRWISVWFVFFFLSQKHRLHWPTSTCASKTRQELSCALRRMHRVENSSSDGQTNSVTPRRRRDNLALFRTTAALSEESLGFSGPQKHF